MGVNTELGSAANPSSGPGSADLGGVMRSRDRRPSTIRGRASGLQRSRRLHVKVQAIAVAMSAGRGRAPRAEPVTAADAPGISYAVEWINVTTRLPKAACLA